MGGVGAFVRVRAWMVSAGRGVVLTQLGSTSHAIMHSCCVMLAGLAPQFLHHFVPGRSCFSVVHVAL